MLAIACYISIDVSEIKYFFIISVSLGCTYNEFWREK